MRFAISLGESSWGAATVLNRTLGLAGVVVLLTALGCARSGKSSLDADTGPSAEPTQSQPPVVTPTAAPDSGIPDGGSPDAGNTSAGPWPTDPLKNYSAAYGLGS